MDIILSIIIMFTPFILFIWYARQKAKVDEMKGIKQPKEDKKDDECLILSDPTHPRNPWFGTLD